MSSEIGNPINYYLNLSGDLISPLSMNQLFGKKLHLKHVGYQCKNGKDKKIYRMGFSKRMFSKVLIC